MNTPLTLKRYQPVALRAWHWMNACIVILILTTVLLRDTFLNVGSNSAVILDKAKAAGVVLDPKLARVMAANIRNGMWSWHYTFGFILAGLIVLRILVAIIYRDFPLGQLFFGFKTLSKSNGTEKREAIHYTGVKATYVAFYSLIVIMAITGLTMYYSRTLGIPRPIVGTIHEVHETLMWFVLAFVVGHVAGVVIGELTKYKGIISDMIHGGSRE